MEIRQLKIKNFGKFHNKEIMLHSGINLIYGENESGKTTLFHFIKSMLFGIEKQRGKAAKFDTYHLYEPWENSLFYEGELKFYAGGKTFRLERGFHKNQKKDILINEEDAEELSIEQGDLHHILDGLSETIFRNTMAISQLKSETDEGLAKELKNYTSGFLTSEESGVNVSKALEQLMKDKKERESKLRNLANKRQIKIAGLKKEQEYIQADLLKRENQLKEYLQIQKERENVLFEQEKKEENRHNKLKMITNIIAVIMIVIGAISLNPLPLKIAVTLFWGVIIVVNQFVVKKAWYLKRKAKQTIDVGLSHVKGAVLSLKEEVQEKEVQLSNLAEVLEETNLQSEQERELQEEVLALDLAYEEILKASYQLQQEIGERLNKEASRILSFLTNEKYQDIRMNQDIATRLNTQNKMIYEEQVSKGTKDEIHFAVRMAFLDMFFGEEKMPVIFDDAFAMYDEKRLAKVLQYLASRKRQVLLFTCHTREEQWMKQLEIPYHKVLLSNE